MALYEATNGSNLTNSWNLNDLVHTWYSLVIIEDGVVEINLPNNNLEGALPQQLGDLVHLKKIDFYRNKINGSIPISIGNLKNLRQLNLGFNQLSSIMPDTLSQSLSIRKSKLNIRNQSE